MKRQIKFIARFFGLIGILMFSFPMLGETKEDFPSRNIKLLIPYAAGGSSDATGRVLADKASKILGQPIEVINKPGGSGTIATAAVASAKPDGYTLGVAVPAQLTIVPHERELSYHPIKDITPIMQYSSFSLALVVRAESPYKKLSDFIDAARANPGALTYATTGAGSIGQLIVEQLAKAEKVKVTHVPFSGGGPALTAVLGGHVTAFAAAEFYPQVAAGKLRVLVLLGERGLEELPGTPTLKDLGYPLRLGVFFGIIGPKGIPNEIVSKLEKAFTEATNDPDFRKVMKNYLMHVTIRNSKDFGELIEGLYNDNGKLLVELGLVKK